MAQMPSPVDEWVPLVPHQFIDAAVSTALAIPTIAAQGGIPKTAKYVAVLTCQGVQAFIRLDGQAVTAALSGGKLMLVGDSLTVFGVVAMRSVRIIRSTVGGTVAVEYYYYAPILN